MSAPTTGDRRRRIVRGGCAAAAVVLLAAPTAPPAGADPPGPPALYTQSGRCVGALPAPTTVANGVGWAQAVLDYPSAWRFTRGEGVRIAVIDTGVNPGPAFGDRLQGLADLVGRGGPGPGLDDCDGHGTLVAGLAAGGLDTTSGFSGVAPAATVLSIRQSSDAFTAPGGSGAGAGTRESLAGAIDYAVGRGAQVVNISEADCQAAGHADSPTLTAAVRAAVAHDVVVVAAAGNLSSDGACRQQNTSGSPPVTAASPADIDVPGVLTVAAVGEDGQPAPFSLAGPWVDIAAPGTAIVSTDPYPGSSGEVDRIATADGSGAIQGTSFAAPYVTGVVALVRARYPDLDAAGVAHLVERTASHPAAPGGRDDAVGYGVVDPVAALTAVDPGSVRPTVAAALPPAPAATGSARARAVVLAGLGVLAGGLVLAATVAGLARRRVRPSPVR